MEVLWHFIEPARIVVRLLAVLASEQMARYNNCLHRSIIRFTSMRKNCSRGSDIMSSDPTPSSPTNRWLLRRIDQAAIAGCCLLFLIALGLYWTAHGGLHGRLIEIEHADKAAVDFKVDINTAEVDELITIPEVGQTLAQRIVQYRHQHGPYQTVDDLRHVRGIGPKTLERLRAYVLPPSPPKEAEGAGSFHEQPATKENPAVAESAKSP